MAEKRFDYVMNEYDEIEYITDIVDCEDRDFIDFLDFANAMANENEQLKEALREELQDNGNTYYIEIFDKLFNLNYDEWNRNERYRECTDWEKILKENGDVE